MIESYIFEMLREKSRVIIPEFGAFLMKQEYKTDNNVTGTFVISFNDFLRFNDGLLIDYISEGEGISKDTSGRLLTEFVKRMKTEIATNGQFELFQMGILKLDDQKKVIFIQTQDPAAVPYADRLFKTKHSFPSYLEDAAFPEEAGSSPEFSQQSDYTSGMSYPEGGETAGGQVEGVAATMEGGRQVESREENQQDGKAASGVELTEEQISATTDRADSHETLSFAKDEADSHEPLSFAKDETSFSKAGSPTAEELKDIEKERTNFGTIVLILILLVLAAGTALYFGGMINLPFKLPFGSDTSSVVINANSDSLDFFAAEPENSITESSFDEDTVTDTDSSNLEEAASDSIVEPQPQEQPQPEPIQEPAVSATNFHYVVGFSIGSMKDAEKKVKDLKTRGFDASIVNQHKGFYRVAYGAYPDRPTAIEAMKSLKLSENNPQAWYLYCEKLEEAQ